MKIVKETEYLQYLELIIIDYLEHFRIQLLFHCSCMKSYANIETYIVLVNEINYLSKIPKKCMGQQL